KRLARAQERSAQAGAELVVPVARGRLGEGPFDQYLGAVDQRVKRVKAGESAADLGFVGDVASLAPAQRGHLPAAPTHCLDHCQADAARPAGDYRPRGHEDAISISTLS